MEIKKEKERHFENVVVEKEIVYYIVGNKKYDNENDAIERERQIELFDNMNQITLNNQTYQIFNIETKEDLELIIKDIPSKHTNNFYVIPSFWSMTPNPENIELKNLPCQVVFLSKEDHDSFDGKYEFIEIENFKELLDQKINEIEKIKSIL